MNLWGWYRLGRYFLVGFSTFALDLLILFALLELGVPYLIAVAIGFLIGVSLNYAISRAWVFRGSDRKLRQGYLYFVTAAGTGLFIILSSVGLLVEVFGLPVIVARIIVSGAVGYGNYLFNLYLNFKVAKKR